MTLIIIICSFLFGCFILGLLIHKKNLAARLENNQIESKKILDQAQKEGDFIIKSALKEAKELNKKRRKEFDDEIKQKKGEIHKLELQLKQKDTALQSKVANLELREQKVSAGDKKLIEQEKQYLKARAEYELKLIDCQKVLERVAHMSKEEAQRKLTKSLEISAKKEAQIHLEKIEEEIQRESSKKAREVVSTAIQRISSNFVSDTTVTVVQLPNDEMKGRIIGREGRNIRAIEQATGVDIIIDDTPEAVILSCFNPIKREIAKISIEKLIADERIHPARIEETTSRVQEEFETTIKDYGEQAAFDSGVSDLHPQLIYLLGKLYFCSTGAQSVLQHSVETSYIAEIMATELGLNPKHARRAGLLHDIGKALDHTTSGHHAQIGSQACKKYGEKEDIVEAVELHHSNKLLRASPLALIIGAANNLSSSRPGARKTLLASYIKRLEDIERLVQGFKQINKAYVLQSGREVRALVHSNITNDQEVSEIAYQISAQIRQEINFPGQIKITVVKEGKHVEYAT
jgi:ribonucrease Y